MMLTVSLVMHSSRSPNLGVGALTVSEIAILRAAAGRLGADLRIEILDWVGAMESYVTGPDIVVRDMTGKTLVSPTGYFSYVRDSDLVIDIGAGDSFADIYGPRRLSRMFLMKYLVHVVRTPMVLGPQTYGPFTKALSTRLARGTLRRSAILASRDVLSSETVRRLAPGIDLIEASDVALRLPYDPPAPRSPGGPVRVGLNVSGLLMSGGYTGRNMFGLEMDYAQMIRALVQRFLEHPEKVELHLVPHVLTVDLGNVEDDMQPCLDLKEMFPQIVVAPSFRDPSQAKSYIAGLDFFTGARMHACIAAFSSGVPVVPMAYSRKFQGMFGTLGYNRTVDCTSEPAPDIIEKIMAGFEERDMLKTEMQPALALGLEKLGRYETALEALMADLIARKRAA
jgi:polysaccharide pyruvyl transferase WcaK-like protein